MRNRCLLQSDTTLEKVFKFCDMNTLEVEDIQTHLISYVHMWNKLEKTIEFMIFVTFVLYRFLIKIFIVKNEMMNNIAFVMNVQYVLINKLFGIFFVNIEHCILISIGAKKLELGQIDELLEYRILSND